VYWPQDQWVALATMLVTVVVLSVAFRGFLSRIAIFLVAHLRLPAQSWVLDVVSGPDHVASSAAPGRSHRAPARRTPSGVASDAAWLGLPAESTDLGCLAAGGKRRTSDRHFPTCRRSTWRSPSIIAAGRSSRWSPRTPAT
jgi:hypothetical protein